MATWIEHLKANGASEEDIKVLDTPAARRAFDAQEARAAAAEAERLKAVEDRKLTEDWYKNTATPEFNKKAQEVVLAKAEADKFRAALRSAKDQGFIDIDDSFFGPGTPGTPTGTPAANPNTRDDPATRNYFTKEEVAEIASREGDAIAIAADILSEHRDLFPDRPLNMRELRKRAVAARTSVENQWMTEFSVPAARQAREQKAREAEQSKWREEGAKAEREKIAREYNPDTRSQVPSNSPFTVRKTAGDIRSKQPWEAGNENSLSDDRVVRVARNLMTRTQ
jgi:hypothetical protein